MKPPPSLSWVASAPQLSEAEQTALAEAANRGDRKAADRLIRSVARELLGMATRLSFKTGLEVEDLFSAALFGACEWLPRFRSDGGMTITAWCVWHGRSQVLKLVRTAFKRNKRLVSSIEASIEEDYSDHFASDEETPDVALERADAIATVRAAAKEASKAMTKVERIAIQGRFYDEKRYAQLGKQVGRTGSAVRFAEKRALAKIKKALR